MNPTKTISKLDCESNWTFLSEGLEERLEVNGSPVKPSSDTILRLHDVDFPTYLLHIEKKAEDTSFSFGLRLDIEQRIPLVEYLLKKTIVHLELKLPGQDYVSYKCIEWSLDWVACIITLRLT